MTLSKTIDFNYLAKITEGANGSELKAIVTEAGMFAIRKAKEQVEVDDMESAISKVLLNKNSSNTVSEGMFV